MHAITESSPENSAPSATEQLAALNTMPMTEIWKLWDRNFPRRPKHTNRNFLVSRLAFRIQEKAYGGLPAKLKDYLIDCGERHSKIKSGRGRERHLMPGSVLVREFEGQEYRVLVAADGFYEVNGKRFKSLSAAAKEITGGHRSGPKFFGLPEKRRE